MIDMEYQYLNEIFENTQKCIDKTTGYITEDDNTTSINLSTIETILIQNAGRFCEHYASDVIYDIKALEKFIEDTTIDNDEQIFIFAIRQSGVDGCGFLTSRLEQCYNTSDHYKLCNDYYRKIFAVKATKKDRTITCELKNIAGNIRYNKR